MVYGARVWHRVCCPVGAPAWGGLFIHSFDTRKRKRNQRNHAYGTSTPRETHNYSPQTQSRRTSHSPHPLTSCFGAVISQVDCAPSKLACAAAKTLLPGPNSSAALFQPSAIVETGFAHGDHENRGPDSHCATS